MFKKHLVIFTLILLATSIVPWNAHAIDLTFNNTPTQGMF